MSTLTFLDAAPPPVEAAEDRPAEAARLIEVIGDVSDDEEIPYEGKQSPPGPLVT